MNFSEALEFTKEVKHFAKKWRSVPNDIKVARQYIVPLYEQIVNGVDTDQYRQRFFNGKTATILYTNADTEVIKMRLDVESLGRNDKVRIVFIAIKNANDIKFIELYAKNEKPREDAKRIRRYLPWYH